MDLVMNAAFRPYDTRIGGQILRIQPGQILTSMRQLSARWSWDFKTVQSFINSLEIPGFLQHKVLNKFQHKITLITILKSVDALADCFQAGEIIPAQEFIAIGARRDHNGSTRTAVVDGKSPTIRRLRRLRREKDSCSFDRFWQLYPRKQGKHAAQQEFQKLKPDNALLGAICEAIRLNGNSAEWTKDNGRWIPHPAKWLRERRWEDELPGEGGGLSDFPKE